MPATAASTAASTTTPTTGSSSTPAKKAASTPDKKYRYTKERPFGCNKCKSTFVRRDLLLRHDRTVHAKDGGAPLVSEVKRRAAAKAAAAAAAGSPPSTAGSSKPPIALDTATLEQIEASSDGMVDLETAAMLMTDLHHKATAAMASQNNHNDGNTDHAAGGNTMNPTSNLSSINNDVDADHTSTTYSPDDRTMFDTGAPYLSGGVSMPHMSWDPFMLQPVNQPKAHSISSSLSGSQDSQLSQSQLSFTSASTVLPQDQHLPSMIERYPSNSGDTLGPGLHPFGAGSLPVSGSATPNGLSPFPYLMGPVSPVNYRRSPGPSQALSSPKAPQIQSEEDFQRIQINLKDCDDQNLIQQSLYLQSREDFNNFLNSYFSLFHHHLPFLHPETFDPATVSPPLLLATLSIGALYTFNQDQAYQLHVGSKILVSQFLQKKDNFDSRKCPLWTMQSTLLNMIFASWSGDSKGLEWACSIKSLLANMIAGSRYELKVRTEAREGEHPLHQEWVDDEGYRRTYYAVYIFFGMLTLTYNHTPAIGFAEFDSLELPSSESLWNLEYTDDEAWREAFAASTVITVREAHDSLFQGEAARYSAFATRVMINALFLEVWSHKRSFEALQDVVTEYKLRLALESWEKSLELCEPETIVVKLHAPHQGHPLIFNAMAVYRNTRARLEVDLKSIQEALRYHDSYEVAAAMTNARDRVKRSQEMIRVIQQCFECIEIVALQGIHWVGRTCATNWSVEHPLCGLDLMVILSLWLYRLEHDEEPATEEELAMYNKVRNLFDDDSMDHYGAKLSSTVARLWGSMLDDVVVWGITKLMGESFKLHSQALVGYQDDIVSQSSASTPTMSSQAAPDLDLEAAVF
ncbi:hypothetical protein MMC25_004860 [Agyrium rufum]|nr:hypothetical protein [Agyrium rufum]